MTDRDYLWCALNLTLDREEELERLCPKCREQAEGEVCPICGEPHSDYGRNGSFDDSRFLRLKGVAQDD